MGRLAVFVDGGYVDSLARQEFKVQLDYGKFSTAIEQLIDQRTVEPVELLRTLFYHCPPHQSARPTPGEARRVNTSRDARKTVSL